MNSSILLGADPVLPENNETNMALTSLIVLAVVVALVGLAVLLWRLVRTRREKR